MSETYLRFYFEPENAELALKLHQLLSAMKSIASDIESGFPEKTHPKDRNDRHAFVDKVAAAISVSASRHAVSKDVGEMAKQILHLYLDSYREGNGWRLLPWMIEHEYDATAGAVECDDDHGDVDLCKVILSKFLEKWGGHEAIRISFDEVGLRGVVIYSDGTSETFDPTEMATIEAGSACSLRRGHSEDSRAAYTERLIARMDVDERDALLRAALNRISSASLEEALNDVKAILAQDQQPQNAGATP